VCLKPGFNRAKLLARGFSPGDFSADVRFVEHNEKFNAGVRPAIVNDGEFIS
jgi:hypothetical protein